MEDDEGSGCEGGPYIEERTPLQVAFHGYMCEQAKQQPKANGDGRSTKKPIKESGNRWGHHENVRDKPADRNKNWKPWRKKA